jgi:hypothetical protein
MALRQMAMPGAAGVAPGALSSHPLETHKEQTELVDRIDADAFCFDDGDAFSDDVYLGGQQCDWCSAIFWGRSEAKGLYAIRCIIVWPNFSKLLRDVPPSSQPDQPQNR